MAGRFRCSQPTVWVCILRTHSSFALLAQVLALLFGQKIWNEQDGIVFKCFGRLAKLQRVVGVPFDVVDGGRRGHYVAEVDAAIRRGAGGGAVHDGAIVFLHLVGSCYIYPSVCVCVFLLCPATELFALFYRVVIYIYIQYIQCVCVCVSIVPSHTPCNINIILTFHISVSSSFDASPLLQARNTEQR